jgi:hypothetical protein
MDIIRVSTWLKGPTMVCLYVFGIPVSLPGGSRCGLPGRAAQCYTFRCWLLVGPSVSPAVVMLSVAASSTICMATCMLAHAAVSQRRHVCLRARLSAGYMLPSLASPAQYAQRSMPSTVLQGHLLPQ